MAVTYPNGDGMDALWESLAKGLSAVEEVSTLLICNRDSRGLEGRSRNPGFSCLNSTGLKVLKPKDVE